MFKFLNRKRKKGQSTVEYAVLIVLVISALLSIQFYLKRGIQGRLKSATDDIGDQFSPGNTNLIETTTTTGQRQETFIAGRTMKNLLVDEVTTTTMNAQIIQENFEYFGSPNAQHP